MKPITIEPNSGVKMAGVKITGEGFDKDNFLEIMFVGKKHFFAKNTNGYEDSWTIDDGDFAWYLYEEPKPEVKWAKAAFFIDDNSVAISRCWFVSENLFCSKYHAEKEVGTKQLIYPARFDADGFLIIPEEFK